MKKYLLIGLIAAAFFIGGANEIYAQKGTNVEKRIAFARGTHSKTIKGFIADRNTTHEYKVGAKAGQKLTLNFVSARKDVDVCVTFPNGGDPEDSCGARVRTLTLPDDGDYSIIIDSKRENTSYTLTVTVK